MADRETRCARCGSPGVYYDIHDAYACERCNEWLEPQCGNEGCGFCVERPAHPSQVSIMDYIRGERL